MTATAFRVRLGNVRLKHPPRAQRALAVTGSSAYEGASVAPRLQNWRINTGGPNSTIGGSLPMLRSRSRDVARKNGLAAGALETLVSQIVGTGIKPLFATGNETFNKELAKLWRRWTDQADAHGRFDFYGLQALAVRSMLEAGEVFARMRARRPGDGLVVPLQIQLLESEFCPVEKTETTSFNRIIKQGIEFNGIDQRTAYWMYAEHPNDNMFRVGQRTDVQPIAASEIAHLAMVTRPGTTRGIPWLAQAIIKLHDLDEYDDAQLIRQKIAAMFAGFMTPSLDGKFAAQDAVASTGVALAGLEPGTMQALDPGATMTFSDPPSMGAEYEAFMKQQHRYIAASLGMLYEQLTGDFENINDRTWRAAMNQFKRRLDYWQHSVVVFQFCAPVIRRWAETALLAGAFRLPAGVTIDDVAMPTWLPPAQEYINPAQDVQARVAEVRAGFKSRAAIVSERGDDVQDVDAQIAGDNKRADQLSLRFDSDGRTDLKGANPSEDTSTQGDANAGNAQ